MNFTKIVSSIVLSLSMGSVANAQWSGSGLSVGIGGGWNQTNWSGNGGRGGSVTNSYINGGIGYTQNSGYGGGGYYGGGGGGGYYGGGGGYYGGCNPGYMVTPIRYNPFGNSYGAPEYGFNAGPRFTVCNPCNPYGGQYWIR